jgi:hypothetical protein
MRMPCANPLDQLWVKLIVGCKIYKTPAFALEDTEPLFHLIHPCAMPGRQVHENAWLMRSPRSHRLPMLWPDSIARHLKRADVLLDVHIQRFETGAAFPVPLPVITVPIDLASTRVKSRPALQRPGTRVLRRHPVRQVGGPGRPGQGRAGPRRQSGRLREGAPSLSGLGRAGVEGNQFGDGGRAGGVSWAFGAKPPMMAPGLQLRRRKKPPHRRGRALRHAPRGDELTRQFGTIPRREATAQHIRPLAGQAHDRDRDLRGNNPRWLHGQGRRPGHPRAGRENAWPSGGPPGVARRPPAPQRLGRTLPPGAG